MAIGMALALLIHGLAVWLILRQPAPSGGASGGMGSYALTLSLSGPEGPATDAPVADQPAEPVPVPDPISPVEPVAPEPVAPMIRSDQAATIRQVEPVEERPEPDVEPEPVAEPTVIEPPPVIERAQTLQEEPRPVEDRAPAQSAQPASGEVGGPADVSTAHALPQGAGGGAVAGDGGRSGGVGSAGNGQSSYAEQLQAWLEQHKTYPRRSRRRGEEGVVMVRFTIDRAGYVLERSIVRRSGFRALDEEALAMLDRASPLPEMPNDIAGTRMTITTPVEFTIY